MKNKLKYLAFAVLTTFVFNATVVYAETTPFKIEAYGMDTIAGYEAPIYSSRTFPNKTVIFTIVKPNGSELAIPVDSTDSGIAEFNLYDFHTKQAGEYKVAARLEDSLNGKFNTFTVYADSVSSKNSKIEPSKLLATADGIDKIYVTVTLKDDQNNPIKGHDAAVISSRAEDEIVRISEKTYTNEDGSIIFALSSASMGVSVYSFIDTTTNVVLDKRLEIAFTELDNVGGWIETAYAAAGEVSTLEFEDLPTTILPNSDTEFDLTAYDSENSIVPNYSGTVHFSVEGANSIYATVPNDYSFDIDFDSGSHTFAGAGNSLTFVQPGTYHVVATDLSNFTIRGEVDILVGSGTTLPDTTPSAFDLVISSPTEGTYSHNEITITGTAPSTDLTIQFFDNDAPLGETSVENDQSFSYQTDELIDGSHTLLALGLDNADTIQYTSSEITFEIDTSAPEVEDIEFSPDTGIKTGEILEITVTSEPNVFQGAVVFNVDIAELEQDPTDSTKYIASIQAPLETGTYPIDVILIDELGNEGSYTDVATIEITESGEGTIIGEEEEEEPEEIVDTPPSDVFGVQSASSDSKVTLTWQAASDDSGVEYYRIYFGLTPSNLSQVVDTLEDNTTWYIPNLVNGNEYFFAVAAVDDTGQESSNSSSIVSGIPFTEIPMFVPPEEKPDVKAQPTEVPDMESTGPEMIWFLLASILVSQLYFKFKNKVC
ncbi:fibronectin type III domain-containing protein [Patescibacteria group bacterium]